MFHIVAHTHTLTHDETGKAKIDRKKNDRKKISRRKLSDTKNSRYEN
jgi:hypothetical protein